MQHVEQQVALEGIKVFAKHGYYAEEQLIGAWFVVDVEASFVPVNFNDELKDTLNYEWLHKVVIEEMHNTQKLLESVLNNILNALLQAYPHLNSVRLSLKKLNPPLAGQVAASKVSLSYKKTT